MGKIPTELIALFDEIAGRQHTDGGRALAGLGRILERHEAIVRERIAVEIETFATLRLRGGGSRVAVVQGRFEGEGNGFAIAARIARGEHPAGGPLCTSRFSWMGAVFVCDRPCPPHDDHGNQAIRWREAELGASHG